MFDGVNKFLKKFRTIKEIDESSSIERLGRDEYKYIEGDHALTLQIEMLSGSPSRVIYSRTIKNWLPPYDKEKITDEKREEIVKKICKYFDINSTSYTIK